MFLSRSHVYAPALWASCCKVSSQRSHCHGGFPLWREAAWTRCSTKQQHNRDARVNCYTVKCNRLIYSFPLTFNSSTRSILFLPRGLISLRMSAMMMSMPLHSWVAIQFWKWNMSWGKVKQKVSFSCHTILYCHNFLW